MDILNIMESRYSVRSFSAKAVESTKIDRILRAGQVAPTACNRQPQRILVLKSTKALEKLQKCKRSHFGETLAFIICYDKNECWKRSYDDKSSGDIDASIVATHMMLEAWQEGIGSTWIMSFDPEALRAEFALGDELEASAILVMGYPADNAAPSPMHEQNKDLSQTAAFL